MLLIFDINTCTPMLTTEYHNIKWKEKGGDRMLSNMFFLFLLRLWHSKTDNCDSLKIPLLDENSWETYLSGFLLPSQLGIQCFLNSVYFAI